MWQLNKWLRQTLSEFRSDVACGQLPIFHQFTTTTSEERDQGARLAAGTTLPLPADGQQLYQLNELSHNFKKQRLLNMNSKLVAN